MHYATTTWVLDKEWFTIPTETRRVTRQQS